MNIKWAFPVLFFCVGTIYGTENNTLREFGLKDIKSLIKENRTVIMENLNKRIAEDNLQQEKTARLPEIGLDGNGYLSNTVPLKKEAKSSNSWLYNFNLATEFDLYTGGAHTYAIKRMKKERLISEQQLNQVEQEIELQAYIMLYDIHRNIKYLDFLNSSIRLREKEYERIDQLYKNGLVLKSDLLRSKLYITNLEKDQVNIKNSIKILSDELCALLGMENRFEITPVIKDDLNYQITESFDELFQYALQNSPTLRIQKNRFRKEEIILKELYAERRPQIKLYAQYGVGSPLTNENYDHQLGGEVGAKVSFSLSSFYKSKNKQRAQKHKIKRERVYLNDEEEKLRNNIFELYTRYHESLLNIERALQKIDLSKESMRILTNSYFNQQALLIDVLESETQSMEASFEWVEAIVDSQKYYWALKQICGYL